MIIIIIGCLILGLFLFRKKISNKINAVETKTKDSINKKIDEAKTEIKSVENEALGYVKSGIDTVKTEIKSDKKI